MKRELVIAGALALVALILSIASVRQTPTIVVAATEEPTKAPYVFPTPIFIPTFPPDPASPTAAPTQVAPAPATPIAQATPPAQPQASSQTYTVQSGDSPWVISQKVYGDGTKYKLILDANNLTTASRLRVGSVLTIPALPGAAPAPIATATQPAAAITAPTLAPTVALTLAPPITATVAITTTLTITPTRAPTASGLIPNSLIAPASIAITILSVMLFIAALVTAVLAFFVFERTRRFEAVESRRARLTRMFKR
ncbi:hypothetical protein ANRL3_00827 [Anaerolineae bacterium]|nr:hypothetical protein ANRL3_00827 [Anaerolineae bacterium]